MPDGPEPPPPPINDGVSPSSGDSSTPPSDPRSLDVDLYCLTCGYNLRGLAGDPIRCPECGNLNPVGDVELPAEMIREQLRRMERVPSRFVIATIFGSPFVVMLGVVLVASRRWGLHLEGLACPGLPTAIMIVVWVHTFWRFRQYCGAKPGWFAALAKYSVLSLLQVGAMVVPNFLLIWVAAGLSHTGPIDRSATSLAVVTISVVIIVLVACTARWVHARATAGFEPLQREVAVRIAREEARKRMASEGQGRLG